ncbi:hypothetical protein LOK49_LG09G01340 [Camellia lanceoleosa]|uniref:Uncharacterized protein n=1 Tax=Camellia lanceoleosa TaxID=1840588 RepID=A0ACC0GIX1_9ERIC|nr:hypothetical protein LOK49_LG09G01340 [Camellia lanceoleosa]
MEDEVKGSMGQEEVDQMSRIGEPEKEDQEVEHITKEELCRKEKKPVAGQDMVDCEAGEKVVGNECISVSAVKETEEDMGNQKVRRDSMEGRLVITANPRNDIQIVEDHVCTPGFIRSIGGPESSRPQINLEVVLDGFQDGVQKNRPTTDSSNVSACVAQTQSRPLVQKQTKLKGSGKDNPVRQGKPTSVAVNTCNKAGGNRHSRSKSQIKQNKQKGVLTGNCFKNGAIFRAAAAAISLSIEHSLNNKRRNKLLNEAQATMEVGKIGADFEGRRRDDLVSELFLWLMYCSSVGCCFDFGFVAAALFITTHDYHGHIYTDPYPTIIQNGQWAAFLHVKPSITTAGSSAAVVYRGKNQSGEQHDWMLAWSMPYIGDNHVSKKFF